MTRTWIFQGDQEEGEEEVRKEVKAEAEVEAMIEFNDLEFEEEAEVYKRNIKIKIDVRTW